MININKINQIFEQFGSWVIRLRYLIVAVFILALVFGFAGLKKIQTDAGWDKWLLDSSKLKMAEDEFKEIFGNNDYVGVLVESDHLFDPKTLALIRALGKELKTQVPFADDIMSITDCEFSLGHEGGIEIITPVPDPIPWDNGTLAGIRDQILDKRLLNGKLISADGRFSWIMLRLTPYPEGWRSKDNKSAEMEVGKVATTIIRQDKYASLNPKSSGMPVIAHDKTAFFQKEMSRTMGLSLVVSLVVLTLALRSIKGITMTVIVTAGSVILTFGILGWIGKPIDVGMIMVPLYLGIAVSIGYSIHIFSFFKRHFLKTGRRKESVRLAVKETGWPILFTALTTVGALCSFHFVDVKPVRWIGSSTSLLVSIVFLMVVIMIPALLSFGKDRTVKQIQLHSNALLENLMAKLANLVLARPVPIIIIFFLAILTTVAGMRNFEVNFDIRKNMGFKVPYVNRLDQVSSSPLGAMYSYNVVVEFPNENMAREPENLKKLDLLEQEALGFPLTKKITSITEIIKDMNQVLHDGNPQFFAIPDTREMVAQIMLLYENAGGREAEKWIDYGYRRLRMTVDLKDYNTVEAYRELHQITQKAHALFPGANVTLAGSVAQFTVMQDIVSKGQLTSFLIAICVITGLMVLVFGNFKIGLIAMIPNITPALAVGGLMGWMRVPLDMMTITIMPMLLGLAVDDTIHFINHAKLAFEQKRDYADAIRHTFSAIGIPLLFTSLILTANFSVYLSSPAKVLFFLGIFTGTGIMTALLTDYFVTPVLLKTLKAFGPETITEQKTQPQYHLNKEVIQ
ncbi:efflux RND transporter permease subunit [Desulfobacter curvatus]|uniref:efflux RND transporter permease subunit n=1 Tax=Desulfobacter curvatus TaxID=2290 RepID=UPI0003823B24|nr:MMPL family transporter [Desulfobacter curvatus]